VHIATGDLAGTEALARWDHPEKGRIAPARFIPLAEESDLIVELGSFVLQTACSQARAWLEKTEAAPRISVNVSARQLQEPGFVDEVARAVEGLPRDRITLEITESQLFEDLDGAAATLLSLKRLGVLLSVDDFGTGYASLSYLKRLPVDTVKIDQSFVADLERSRHDRRIVEAVTTLSSALGAKTIAEGVETKAQLDLLRDLGCDYAQGYLFSRPVSPELILGLQQRQALRL
jgi:EAL domain-containing protein (putative c-di-GMP-specific phosphodiesterase class I)